jgi:NADH:ubiquinone oxidoreductase subunit H
MLDVIVALITSGVLILAFIAAAACLVYGERKVVSYMQVRVGPNSAPRGGRFADVQPGLAFRP